MAIQLNIDDIQIEGNGNISEAQLRRAIEQELAQRLANTKFPGQKGNSNSKININEINLNMGTNTGPIQMAQQIAEEIQNRKRK